jgi:uncharacterized membrane protein YjfL (UPF0719 family)
MFDGLWDLDAAAGYVNFKSLAFLLEALVLIWIGKIIRDVLSPFNINEELTSKDNKALAVSYSGYMIGQGIVILGILQGPSVGFVEDLIAMAGWSLGGIILLNIAMIINDKFLLSRFDTRKEIIEDRNVGTGAVQFGACIGTAMIIRAVVTGESAGNLQHDIVSTLIFFLIGQIGFILFSKIYQLITAYDIHAEIEKDNEAAGVGFGLTLAAVGVIMSNTLKVTESLAAFGVWFVTGLVLLVITRFLVDRLILPGNKLDKEITEDRNWGAALIEGGAAIIVALILNASFA